MYAIKLIRQRLDLLVVKMAAFSALVAALTKRNSDSSSTSVRSDKNAYRLPSLLSYG